MTRYRGNAEAVRSLVRETEVHRDVYIDDEVFALEMEHLFANTWIYVGHDSQVAKPGDYFGTTIGAQPVLMVRHTDNSVKVLHNRCPHKERASRLTRAAIRGNSFAAPITRGPLERTAHCSLSRCGRDTKTPDLRRAMRARGSAPFATYAIIAASSLQSSTTQVLISKNFSAKASAASTTWSTGRRPGGSKLPEACCATCTIAIGRCWWRTRPTRPIRWSPMNPRLAPRSRSGRRRHPEPKSRWRSKSTRLSWRHTNFSRIWAFASGRMVMATPACITPFIPITPPCPAISKAWRRPLGKNVRRRSWTRTATTRFISPT